MLIEKNWKPAFTIKKALDELMKLVMNPDVNHPANGAVCEELKKNKAQFHRKAVAHTRQNAMRR